MVTNYTLKFLALLGLLSLYFSCAALAVQFPELTGCDTMDTDGTGIVSCGSDDDVPDAGDFSAATDLDLNGALNTDSVSANELDAAGVEAELEAVIDHDDLQNIQADEHYASGTWGADLVPSTDSSFDLGSSVPKYWAEIYADKFYLNSRATLDGTQAGYITLTDSLSIEDGSMALTSDQHGISMRRGFTNTSTNSFGLFIWNIWSPGSTTSNNKKSVGVGGYAGFDTANYGTNNKVYGLDFAPWVSGGTTAGHATNLTTWGIRTFGVGGWANTINAATAYGLDVMGISNSAATISVTNVYALYIRDNTGSSTVTNHYGLYIEEPTDGSSVNRQINLAGNGSGSGIWFDSAERLYSDGTDLVVTPEIKLSDTNTGGATRSTYLCLGSDNTICRCNTCN